MMRIIGAILILMLALLLVGCGGGGTPATGSLAGFIYRDAIPGQMVFSAHSRSGLTAIAGAVVTAAGFSATTDSTGTFQLQGIPCGETQVQVTAPAFTSTRMSVKINEGENALVATTPGAPVKSKWTVLIYMAADNSLSLEGLKDLNEMETVGSTDQVKVVVQYDKQGSADTRRYEIAKDDDLTKVTSPVVQDLPNVDSGNPAVLRDFLLWGQRNYPAEHYMLVLWDHGSGWDPDSRSLARSISQDDPTGNVISITELPGALQTTQPIDIIAADACLMSMQEVAYEIRNCADYYVSSEELEPVSGYNYARILNNMITPAGLALSPGEVSDMIAREAREEWADYNNMTTSVIKLDRTAAVTTALDSLAHRLRQVVNFYPDELKRARVESVRFGLSAVDLRVDLYDYAARLQSYVPDSEVASRANALQLVINNAVTANYVRPGRGNARGISIYLPTSETYFAPRTFSQQPPPSVTYPELQLAHDSDWDEWLALQP